MNLQQARQWIAELNQNHYAGLSDWRLPTLEEATSLLEEKKMNGNLYIDPLFDRWQWCILTADTLENHLTWVVASSGRVDWFDADVPHHYARPVCGLP